MRLNARPSRSSGTRRTGSSQIRCGGLPRMESHLAQWSTRFQIPAASTSALTRLPRIHLYIKQDPVQETLNSEQPSLL